MEMAIMMCAVVIAVCILTNKFTSKMKGIHLFLVRENDRDSSADFL